MLNPYTIIKSERYKSPMDIGGLWQSPFVFSPLAVVDVRWVGLRTP